MATQILLSKPSLSGNIRQTAFYNAMTIGETAPILLIGHSDAINQYTPYRIRSMKEAINWLQADSTSPLVRGLLEAYNMGCRDIWLYSAAPMSEYRSSISARNTVEPELGNKTFYEKWSERLDDAYSILKEYDSFQVVVPIEASLTETSDIDFATPLAQLCEDVFVNSSRSVLGVIGTRSVGYNQALFDELETNSVFDTIGGKGKYIMAVLGEGIIANGQMSSTYSSPFATQAAALLCITPLNRSIFGIKFSPTIALTNFDLTDAQIEQLAQTKVNPVVRAQRGKRGFSFQTMLITDNTMAPDSSDFWSMNQMRTVTECVNTIRSYSDGYIGTSAAESFKNSIYDYFKFLVRGNFIKDFALDIRLEPSSGSALVDVGITPVFGIRNIYFTVQTGPGS